MHTGSSCVWCLFYLLCCWKHFCKGYTGISSFRLWSSIKKNFCAARYQMTRRPVVGNHWFIETKTTCFVSAVNIDLLLELLEPASSGHLRNHSFQHFCVAAEVILNNHQSTEKCVCLHYTVVEQCYRHAELYKEKQDQEFNHLSGFQSVCRGDVVLLARKLPWLMLWLEHWPGLLLPMCPK